MFRYVIMINSYMLFSILISKLMVVSRAAKESRACDYR